MIIISMPRDDEYTLVNIEKKARDCCRLNHPCDNHWQRDKHIGKCSSHVVGKRKEHSRMGSNPSLKGTQTRIKSNNEKADQRADTLALLPSEWPIQET